MPTYPGDPPFERAVTRGRAQGDPAEVSRLTLGSHAGTHVDVPRHFVEGGADLSSVSLLPFIGPCRVVEATGLPCVDAAEVEAISPAAGERILFKTDNSARWRENDFAADFAYLTPAAAQTLAGRGVSLVGWDYLSVEAFGAEEAEAHNVLLASGVLILEGLDLSGAPAGTYFLAALPLAVAGGDGAPARAVLLEGVYAEETA